MYIKSVSNILPSLMGMSRSEYDSLKASGMMWVYYPHATGNYEKDCKVEVSVGGWVSKDDFHVNIPEPTKIKHATSTDEFLEKSGEVDVGKNSVEKTGKSVSYYRATVDSPTSDDIEPYTAECNDLIEALNMTYAEANVFKAIWRKCAERELGLAKEGNSQIYDSEKMVFFSDRVLKTDMKNKV